MKLFERNKLVSNFKSTVFIAGTFFVCITSFNTLHADGFKGGIFQQKVKCELKCTPQGQGTYCVFVPEGCNNARGLEIPNKRLDQVTNPRMVNPRLINPKRKFLPGDQFQPNKLK